MTHGDGEVGLVFLKIFLFIHGSKIISTSISNSTAGASIVACGIVHVDYITICV